MKDLKILIIGSAQLGSIDHSYYRHLKDYGVNIEFCTLQDEINIFYNKSLITKAIVRMRMTAIHRKVNIEILKVVERFKPHVVWIFKGMEIFPSLINVIRNKGVLLVNYNADNPFIFAGKGSGNSNIIKSIELYDLHLTYNPDVKLKLELEYNKPAYIIPFGYDLPNGYTIEMDEEINKVCFIGNPDTNRVNAIKYLSAHGIPIDIYGNNWGKYLNDRNIKIHPPVYNESHPATLIKYRVQLNLMRIHNLNSHNMRSFEVPAAGGILLTPNTPDHRQYFSDGIDVFLYDSLEDCKNKALQLLSMSASEAFKIRTMARKNSIEKGYSYRERAKEALNIIMKCAIR